MKVVKITGVILILWGILTFVPEIGEQFSIPGMRNMVPTAEAIIGRPLTPVSYAGVARRTVRRW